MTHEKLIGKQVLGFKYKTISGISYNNDGMDPHVGKIGTITAIHNTKYCQITFSPNVSYWYPVNLTIKQLIEPLIEEEIDIDALFEQIKNI